jgi:hypothetical protein
MTATATAPGAGTRAGSRLRPHWDRWRWPVAVAVVVLVSALVGLVLLRPTSQARLDPRSATPDGARAVVRVLGDHGVRVGQRSSDGDVRGDVGALDGHVTVMVARTDLLTSTSTATLRAVVERTRAQVVLVEAPATVLADLDLPVEVAMTQPPSVLEPRCQDPVALRAGRAVGGDVAYRSSSATAACYPTDEGYTYLRVPSPGGGSVTLLGSGDALTNGALADEGNASLAVGALGSEPVLVWWTPALTSTPAGAGEASLTDLLPRQVGWIVAQLVVVLLLLMLWRGRRLGRLVTEPLPVVVPSVETTLGRAALYRRARARGRAAQVLRAAAGRRIAVACGLPRTAPPPVVAELAATRTGRTVADVNALLAGPAPADDLELVSLARALDSMESALRREVAHQ